MRAATEQQPLTPEPLAHLDEVGRPHLLHDHLVQVGERAHEFAERFGAGEWARLAGRWHDLGKYAHSFQRIIREENGFEAHLEKEGDNSPRVRAPDHVEHRFRASGMPPGSR